MNLNSISLSEQLKTVNPTWVKLRDSFLLNEQAPNQRELEDLIIDLLPALNALAQEGRIFAAWSLETIFIDPSHRTYLLPGYSTPLQKLHAPESLFAGFAALEQYTIHESYPLGAHTDVYGLAMVLRTIILRIIPTPAIDRLEQEIEFISNLNPPGFSRLFLRALDHASALRHTERLASMQDWVQMLNLVGPAPGNLIDRLHTNYAYLLQQQYLLIQQHQAEQSAFFDPFNVQANRAQSYRAPQAPVFSSPYQAYDNAGLMVNRQERVIKDISPSRRSSDADRALVSQQWEQQRKRSAAMVPVTSHNKTTGRSTQSTPKPTRQRRSGFGVPLLVANIIIACTTVYFAVYYKTPTPQSTVSPPEQITVTESATPSSTKTISASAVDQARLAQAKEAEMQQAAETQRQQAAAEQHALAQQKAAEAEQLEREQAAEAQRQQEAARQQALAQQREREQAAEAQRQREAARQRTLTQQREREQAAEAQRQREQVAEQRALAQQKREQEAVQRLREQASVEQRQREIAASQQQQRTQSANTTQREQNLERTLRTIDNRPEPAPPSANTSTPAPNTPSTTRIPPTPAPAATANIGTVRFNIRPWGNITINGTNHGASPPLSNLRLAPGTYSIRVENGSFPAYTTSITVTAGQNTTVSHGFRR